ncbi:M48 family metallopeptidase [Candidatus Saccharibacteria bacterium]|nr:M48 family metallopeptidase [Candidatus Saccharibacteria bacterium]
MTAIIDAEFGEMVVKRSAKSRSIRIHIGTDGRFVIAAPKLTPLAFIKLTVAQSRDSLRQLLASTPRRDNYTDGQPIGQHHKLAIVHTGMVALPTTKVERNRLLVMLPPQTSLDENTVQQQIRDTVTRILRREAKAYLPDKLAAMARQHGFHYERVRFSHSGGRWGSCSSTGTISLNIALMKLDPVLIDYVLAHELSHTRQMNHSSAFWSEVAAIDPHYKLHRQQLKRESPVV